MRWNIDALEERLGAARRELVEKRKIMEHPLVHGIGYQLDGGEPCIFVAVRKKIKLPGRIFGERVVQLVRPPAKLASLKE